MDSDKFIFCLEGVSDIENHTATEVVKNLEKLAFDQGILVFTKPVIQSKDSKKA